MPWRCGFTGTREEPTLAQRRWLAEQIEALTDDGELHHGACVGADTAAHWQALDFGVPVVVHPPINQASVDPKVLVERAGVAIRMVKDYAARNKDIVDACDMILALPRGKERLRSGTWATVRYAVKRAKPVLICYPDGTEELR